MIPDPTREELVQAINNMPFASEFDEFDREEAIYWLASDWHGGQSSNLYSVLSTSEFRPGRSANGPEETAQMLYDELVAEFFG